MIVCLGSLVLSPIFSFGVDYTWDAIPDNANWSVAANWTPTGGPPNVEDDTATIPNSSINPVLDADITVGKVRITGNTATLTVIDDDASETTPVLLTDNTWD